MSMSMQTLSHDMRLIVCILQDLSHAPAYRKLLCRQPRLLKHGSTRNRSMQRVHRIDLHLLLDRE